jgi:hypothetical protein
LLGGFTALLLRGIPTIVINLCLHPSLELPKRCEISDYELQNFQAAEKRLFDNIDRETCRLFSTNDELFSYREEYERHIGRTISIRVTHKISEDSIKMYVAPEVMKIKKTVSSAPF